MALNTFSGYSEDAVTFYYELASNNKRDWFENRRDDFERFVMEPTRLFVAALGEEIRKFAPGVIADPRVDRSVFRIYRDTRFSKDKSPFKTHLGLWFWEGGLPRKECSGFYFQLQPPYILLAVGIHEFNRDVLKEYRRSVIHPEFGPQLSETIDKVTDGPYTIGGKHYKKVPPGFDPECDNSDLLLYNGLYAASEIGIPESFYKPDFVGFCAVKFRDMSPLHSWLRNVVERAATDGN